MKQVFYTITDQQKALISKYMGEPLPNILDYNHIMQIVEAINCENDFAYRVQIGREFCSIREEKGDSLIVEYAEDSTVASIVKCIIFFLEVGYGLGR